MSKYGNKSKRTTRGRIYTCKYIDFKLGRKDCNIADTSDISRETPMPMGWRSVRLSRIHLQMFRSKSIADHSTLANNFTVSFHSKNGHITGFRLQASLRNGTGRIFFLPGYRSDGVTLIGFDSFLQITLIVIVEMLSF